MGGFKAPSPNSVNDKGFDPNASQSLKNSAKKLTGERQGYVKMTDVYQGADVSWVKDDNSAGREKFHQS